MNSQFFHIRRAFFFIHTPFHPLQPTSWNELSLHLLTDLKFMKPFFFSCIMQIRSVLDTFTIHIMRYFLNLLIVLFWIRSMISMLLFLAVLQSASHLSDWLQNGFVDGHFACGCELAFFPINASSLVTNRSRLDQMSLSHIRLSRYMPRLNVMWALYEMPFNLSILPCV